jgi:hypothetical protein
VNEHRTLAPSARAGASEYAASKSDQFVEAARTALATALTNAAAVDSSRIRPPPIRGPWSLWPDALQVLVSLVAALRPQRVLEFASGLLTRVLACACAESRLAYWGPPDDARAIGELDPVRSDELLVAFDLRYP